MKQYPPYCQPRGGKWHFYRKVPLWARGVETRQFIDQTTGIKVADDPHGRRAAIVAHARNSVMEQLWAARIQGNGEAAEANYAEAVRQCLALGHPPVTLSVLATGPAAPIVNRVNTLKPHMAADQATNGHAAATEAAAVCGLVRKVTIRISKMPERYETVMEDFLKKKTLKWQVDKWRRPFVKVMKEFKSVVGDLDLSQLTKEHVKAFRKWMRKQVDDGLISEATANHHFSDLSGMYKDIVGAHDEWDLDQHLFAGIHFPKHRGDDEEENKRPPYSDEFIQTKLLAEGAFDKLTKNGVRNDEAIRALYVMIEGGFRNAEVLNLRRKRVRDVIGNGIPFVQIRGDGRTLKNANSKRQMPLVGVARAAIVAQLKDIDAKLAAEGKEQSPDDPLFPSYIKDPGAWSKEVNAYLKANDLCETVDPDEEDDEARETSIYSLRHSFEDRMVHIHVTDQMRDFMMGHKKEKVRYGKGPRIELKLEWLDKMYFREFPREV